MFQHRQLVHAHTSETKQNYKQKNNIKITRPGGVRCLLVVCAAGLTGASASCQFFQQVSLDCALLDTRLSGDATVPTGGALAVF